MRSINFGYKKLSKDFRRNLEGRLVSTAWMDRLPGGSWKDPGVLRDYIREQLKGNDNEQEDHRCKATDQETKHGVDDRDTTHGQTGSLF